MGLLKSFKILFIWFDFTWNASFTLLCSSFLLSLLLLVLNLNLSCPCIFFIKAAWMSSVEVFSKPWLEENPRMAIAKETSICIFTGFIGLIPPEDIFTKNHKFTPDSKWTRFKKNYFKNLRFPDNSFCLSDHNFIVLFLQLLIADKFFLENVVIDLSFSHCSHNWTAPKSRVNFNPPRQAQIFSYFKDLLRPFLHNNIALFVHVWKYSNLWQQPIRAK